MAYGTCRCKRDGLGARPADGLCSWRRFVAGWPAGRGNRRPPSFQRRRSSAGSLLTADRYEYRGFKLETVLVKDPFKKAILYGPTVFK
jgi:hypothetical protein